MTAVFIDSFTCVMYFAGKRQRIFKKRKLLKLKKNKKLGNNKKNKCTFAAFSGSNCILYIYTYSHWV